MEEIVTPSILPGFMELLPEEQLIFNEIKREIENTFIHHGFFAIDTPAIEKSEILFAKGGGETEKQIFKVDKGSKDMALRFDLTVPLARYVSQHFNELNFPFRRYHIAKVYRGERNQKGRFKEFYQCDIDIVGNNDLSIKNDAQLPFIISEILFKIGLEDFKFHINNRKILNGLLEYLNIKDFISVLRTIDKIHKIGTIGVEEELCSIKIEEEKIKLILNFISKDFYTENTFEFLEKSAIENEKFESGINELKTLYKYMILFGVPKEKIVIDLGITRGLDYYTGSVFETFIDGHIDIGSICSGGRYDDLASNYTKNKLPGVGLSIGLSRLFYKLKEMNLLKKEAEVKNKIKAIIFPVGETDEECIKISNELRKNDIISYVYFEDVKLKKKFSYADRSNIPYAITIGEEELTKGLYNLKNMKTGDIFNLNFENLILKLK